MAMRCLCALAALLAVASAQGSEEGAGGAGEESLGDYASQFEEAGAEKVKKIGPHPDVKAAYVFPDFAKPRFPMGENVDMLVAFHNTGKKAFTLTSISGTLNSPYDFSFIVQNFTTSPIGLKLAPNEQRSVAYKFTPDGRLEALDFHLHLFATYADEGGEQFVDSLYNGTTTLIESASETKSKRLFVLLLVSVACAIAGFKAYTRYQKFEKKKEKAKKRAEAEALASKPNLSDDWLAGMPGMKSKKEKTAKPASKAADKSSKKA